MNFPKLKMLYRQLKSEPVLMDVWRPMRHRLRTLSIWLVLSEILMTSEAYPTKLLISGIASHNLSAAGVWRIAGLAGVLFGLSLVTRFFAGTQRARFFRLYWSRLWGYGHHVEQRQSVAWHTQRSTGEKQSIMTNTVQKAAEMGDLIVWNTLPAIMRIVVTTIGLGIFSGLKYVVISVTTLCLYLITVAAASKWLGTDRRLSRAEMKCIERFGTQLTTVWRTAKNFGVEDRLCQENQQLMEDFRRNDDARMKRFMCSFTALDLVVYLSRSSVIVVIGLAYRRHGDAGTAAMVFGWMVYVYAQFANLSVFQRYWHEISESLRDLMELILTIPDVRQPADPQWPTEVKGCIEFSGVSFRHPSCDSKREALTDINLTIEPYQSIGLVGFSGSGKSTLASLINLSYRPSKGTIKVDGVDLETIDYLALRQRMVAVVDQNLQLLDGTIADNIRLGRPLASLDEVVEVARLAGAADFIEDLPLGYDTLVGENGIRLSGGQRQRLAIARALICHPAILILDEATSSLDALSQALVQETIDGLIRARVCTIIIIAHRFSTIAPADTVVVLDRGKISQLGTHAELAAQPDGIYCALRDLEARGIRYE